jgi:hypothetical protein
MIFQRAKNNEWSALQTILELSFRIPGLSRPWSLPKSEAGGKAILAGNS